jgi:hypothetical protein
MFAFAHSAFTKGYNSIESALIMKAKPKPFHIRFLNILKNRPNPELFDEYLLLQERM